MVTHINHRGPGHSYMPSTLDRILNYIETYQPLVFVDMKAKDYVDAMSLMIGKPIRTMHWDDMPIDTNMFFTYVTIPDL